MARRSPCLLLLPLLVPVPSALVLPLSAGGPSGGEAPAPRGAGALPWIEALVQDAYLKASNTDFGDSFGRTVAVSGATVAVGAVEEDSAATGVNGNQQDESAPGSGAVYVFVRDPATGVWSQQAWLKPSNTDAGDRFGAAIALSGDLLAVGAPWEDSGAAGVNGSQSDNGAPSAGAVYVFVRDPATGTWTQEAYLKASNAEAGDEFGTAVALSGGTLVVTAWREDSQATGVGGDPLDNTATDSGAAYVFVRDPASGTWSEVAYLKASNTGAGDKFGSSVAADGDLVVVGAPLEDSASGGVNGNQTDESATDAGAAYVFRRDPATGIWSQEAYLKSPAPDFWDQFAASLALSEDRVAAGVPFEDVGGASDAGAVCVFKRDPSSGSWSLEACLSPAFPDPNDNAGLSVALSGGRLAVGAENEDGSGSGTKGEPEDDSLPDAGAVFLYTWDPAASLWSESGYLKASNPDSMDEFGGAVALDGSFLVVGADREQSAATGVNGDQEDDSSGPAGAAYAFDLEAVLLAASSTAISASAGGAVDYDVDFPAADAGVLYGLLLSATGTGPTELFGLEVPLTADTWYTNSLQGIYPPYTSGFSGVLDVFGDAQAQVAVPPGVLPGSLVGRTFWLSAVNLRLAAAADAVSLTILP